MVTAASFHADLADGLIADVVSILAALTVATANQWKYEICPSRWSMCQRPC